MNFIKTDNTALINQLRKTLYQTFTTAIDSMWESLYIGASQPYLIVNDNQNIGYCCIDENKSLTQVFLQKEALHLIHNAIESLIETKLITSAKLSSIEPVAFNACLFYSKSIEKDTFCFQFNDHSLVNSSTINLKLTSKKDIEEVKVFYKTQLGFDDNFGYTENLVKRKELFIIRDENTLLATGECRLSDSQPEFADIGVAVNKAHRGKGYATQILQELVQIVKSKKRSPICSTTLDNIASKKAIEKAGFYCSHIIFNIHF